MRLLGKKRKRKSRQFLDVFGFQNHATHTIAEIMEAREARKSVSAKVSSPSQFIASVNPRWWTEEVIRWAKENLTKLADINLEAVPVEARGDLALFRAWLDEMVARHNAEAVTSGLQWLDEQAAKDFRGALAREIASVREEARQRTLRQPYVRPQVNGTNTIRVLAVSAAIGLGAFAGLVFIGSWLTFVLTVLIFVAAGFAVLSGVELALARHNHRGVPNAR